MDKLKLINGVLDSVAVQMIADRERVLAAREAANLAAQLGWDDIERGSNHTPRSPVTGLAARIRSAKAPRPLLPGRREAERDLFKRRLKQAYDQNRVPYRRPEDDSRYFPHQGVRECARRRGGQK